MNRINDQMIDVMQTLNRLEEKVSANLEMIQSLRERVFALMKEKKITDEESVQMAVSELLEILQSL